MTSTESGPDRSPYAGPRIDVDMAAFRKAGDKAYETLKILDAKNQVHKEIGKK